MSTYRKRFGAKHVLIRVIGDWKNIVGIVFTGLSKAFDCIPHDLLIAKMSAYGFTMEYPSFHVLLFKEKETKQNVKINNIKNLLKIISGVPQCSILDSILLDLFINDLFLFIKKVNLANFAEDNASCAASKDITSLLEISKFPSEEPVN